MSLVFDKGKFRYYKELDQNKSKINNSHVNLSKNTYDYEVTLSNTDNYQVNATLADTTNYKIANLTFPRQTLRASKSNSFIELFISCSI